MYIACQQRVLNTFPGRMGWSESMAFTGKYISTHIHIYIYIYNLPIFNISTQKSLCQLIQLKVAQSLFFFFSFFVSPQVETKITVTKNNFIKVCRENLKPEKIRIDFFEGTN